MAFDTIAAVNADYVVGIDLGGTNVRAAAFDIEGTPASDRVELPSRAGIGVGECVLAIAECIRRVAREHQPKVIGMAVPGHIDRGTVKWAPNFVDSSSGEKRHWSDIPLVSLVEKQVGVRTVMGNDANLAALGEYRFGVGKNRARGFILVTLGTGIGTGVVLSPETVSGGLSRPTLLIGGNGGAPELGHQVICESGEPHPSGAVSGTLEAYCSTSSILRRAWTHEDLIRARSPLDLFEMAEEGNRNAQTVWEETGFWLGVGVANLINAFAPEMVALGGQISRAGNWLMEPTSKSAKAHCVPSLWADCNLVFAERVEDAGILGAAALALESL